MGSKRIAFIGLGVMGRSMAGHLLEAGHSLAVHTRTKSKARSLLDRGAHWRDSPAEAAGDADAAITMVGYPQDVESVYLGESGLLGALPSGALAIDMTTSSPALAERLYEAGRQRGVRVLDAPVSGGDLGAKEARLSIMAGGDQAAFEEARPLLEAMGRSIVLQGPAGSGQRTKLCNQIAIAGGLVAIGEALGFAQRSGLRIEQVMRSIESGAAGSWSLSHLAPRALQGDYSAGFFVKHFLKDMKLALETAAELDIDLPALQMAYRLYDRLMQDGRGDEGTQALFRYYFGDPRDESRD